MYDKEPPGVRFRRFPLVKLYLCPALTYNDALNGFVDNPRAAVV